MQTKYHFPVRVYVEDTDFQGFVYHANYLKFMERARTEWLRESGVNQVDVSAQGCFYLVTGIDIKYHQPARMDDQLEVVTHIEHVKRVTMRLAQDIYHVRDGSLVTSSLVRIGYLTQDLKPHALPEFN